MNWKFWGNWFSRGSQLPQTRSQTSESISIAPFPPSEDQPYFDSPHYQFLMTHLDELMAIQRRQEGLSLRTLLHNLTSTEGHTEQLQGLTRSETIFAELQQQIAALSEKQCAVLLTALEAQELKARQAAEIANNVWEAAETQARIEQGNPHQDLTTYEETLGEAFRQASKLQKQANLKWQIVQGLMAGDPRFPRHTGPASLQGAETSPKALPEPIRPDHVEDTVEIVFHRKITLGSPPEQINSMLAEALERHPEGVLLGRAKDTHLQFEHKEVSGRHLRITRSGSAYEVGDLNSRNGTWIGQDTDKPIHNIKVIVPPGTSLQLPAVPPFKLPGSLPMVPPGSAPEVYLQHPAAYEEIWERMQSLEPAGQAHFFKDLLNASRSAERLRLTTRLEADQPDVERILKTEMEAVSKRLATTTIDALTNRLTQDKDKLQKAYEYLIGTEDDTGEHTPASPH